MESGHVRRKDTTKGPPLRILSLDGGGVRGYSIFIILQEIMHKTFVEMEGRAPRRSEIPKPADHFDLIIGTGTGGLIALMLGRLRLDLETCKELYVRLTRMVFQTDKTILGIPTRPTLFKASMLEMAIKEAVREHTVDETEGNDGSESPVSSFSPLSSRSRLSAASGSTYPRRHGSNASTVSFSARSPAAQMARPAYSNMRGGDPNASLYDSRENRTKTAVTAIYKGTSKGGEPAILRSYDSRKETASEFECKIWEAGRATCAIGLAFKPIKVGQSWFHDDGAGTFNPAIQALDEATVNEWPGRDVGVFLSVGTGKRPKTSDANQTLWYEGFLGEFAEARKRLIAKIEGCETIHQYIKKEHLVKRGVNIENYYRLNVEMGVGEFGMNEWNRLADISTGTRQYLRRPEENVMVQGAATKLAKIHRAKLRMDRIGPVPELVQTLPEDISMPLAVELPGDFPMYLPNYNRSSTPPSRQSYDSGPDSIVRPPALSSSPASSGERPLPPPPPGAHAALRPAGSPPRQPSHPPPAAPLSSHGSPSIGSASVDSFSYGAAPGSSGGDDDLLVVTALTPSQWRTASGQDKIPVTAIEDHMRQPIINRHGNQQHGHRIEPPPLPPKTPLPEHQAAGGSGGASRRPGGAVLPYPTDDEPPPMVNMAKKPDYRGRH